MYILLKHFANLQAMKKLALYILLVLHINSFMFLPQGQDIGGTDAHGRQIEDINSLVEWVRIALGYDRHADDEDDDNANNLLLVKTFNKVFDEQSPKVPLPALFASKEVTPFPEYDERISLNHFIEVATPPPNFIC